MTLVAWREGMWNHRDLVSENRLRCEREHAAENVAFLRLKVKLQEFEVEDAKTV